jgi:hypothetical protein
MTSESRANQACVIFLRYADGDTGLTPVFPRYIAEVMVGNLNFGQHWKGRRLVGCELKPLSFEIARAREPYED